MRRHLMRSLITEKYTLSGLISQALNEGKEHIIMRR
jgi:hypothetical protein